MITAVKAVRRFQGIQCDAWDLSLEEDYQEEIYDDYERKVKTLTSEMISDVFAHYDPVALGTSLGATAALGLFLASAVLLIKGGEPVGPMLSLLGNYLLGYTVTWGGSIVGAVEAGTGGFLFGYLLAKIINWIVEGYELILRSKLEMMRTMD